MTNEKVLEAVKFYQKRLPDVMSKMNLPVAPARINLDQDTASLSRTEILNHLLWMLNEIPSLIKQERKEKAMRWLGFVQGSLFTMGLITTQ